MHDHDHSHSHDLSDRNRQHFDSVASTIFDTPWIVKLAAQHTAELRSNFAWINVTGRGNDATLLDYACGNGMVSRALAPYISTALGIDVSPGMVEQYDKTAREEGFADKMSAVQGDFLAGELEDRTGFDFIVMSAALHHVSDVKAMLESLADRLNSGGVLLIIDFVHSEGWNTESPLPQVLQTVNLHHAGFREEEMRQLYAECGLDFAWRLFKDKCEMPEQFGGEKQAFMARGVKQTWRGILA